MSTRENFKIKQPVTFGRTNGATARGVIIKLNPRKAKVELTAQYNSHSAGTVFTVPYNLLESADGSVIERKPQKIEANIFQDQAEVHILKAILCVYSDLEPEALHCDGERTITEVRRISGMLNRRLKGLFAAYGRPVDESEVYEWDEEYKNMLAKRAI